MPLDARRGVQDFPYQADAWLYDAITSNPGADGGAVVTADGKLVGMIGRVIESKSTGTRLNYAVPADLLGEIRRRRGAAADGRRRRRARRPTWAFACSPSAAGGLRPTSTASLPGGPAAAAGLKTDDLVVTIGGQVVRDASDFRRLAEVAADRPGSRRRSQAEERAGEREADAGGGEIGCSRRCRDGGQS